MNVYNIVRCKKVADPNGGQVEGCRGLVAWLGPDGLVVTLQLASLAGVHMTLQSPSTSSTTASHILSSWSWMQCCKHNCAKDNCGGQGVLLTNKCDLSDSLHKMKRRCLLPKIPHLAVDLIDHTVPAGAEGILGH